MALIRKREQLSGLIKAKTALDTRKAVAGEEISMCRQRIRYLKRLVQDCQESLGVTKESSVKLASVNERRKLRLPLFEDKVSKISR